MATSKQNFLKNAMQHLKTMGGKRSAPLAPVAKVVSRGVFPTAPSKPAPVKAAPVVPARTEGATQPIQNAREALERIRSTEKSTPAPVRDSNTLEDGSTRYEYAGSYGK